MVKATQHKFEGARRPFYAVAGAGELAYKKARALVEDFDPKAARAKVEAVVTGLQKQAVDYQAKATESAKSVDAKAARAKMESLITELQEQAKQLPTAVEGLIAEVQEQAKTLPGKAQEMVGDFDAKSMQTKAGSVYAEVLEDIKKTLAELASTYSSLADHGHDVVSGKPEEPAPKPAPVKKPAAKKAPAKKAAAKKAPAKKAPAKKVAAKKAPAKKAAPVPETPVAPVAETPAEPPAETRPADE